MSLNILFKETKKPTDYIKSTDFAKYSAKSIDKTLFQMYNDNRKRQDLKRLCQSYSVKITRFPLARGVLFFYGNY